MGSLYAIQLTSPYSGMKTRVAIRYIIHIVNKTSAQDVKNSSKYHYDFVEFNTNIYLDMVHRLRVITDMTDINMA